jgi:predicted nucleic acid-binding protein
MKDRFFIDSNIALYVLDINESKKKKIASALIDKLPFISPQVVFECLNVSLKKQKLEKRKALNFVNKLIAASFILPETESIVRNALLMYSKYNLQPYDSKIVASALDGGCSILYSEDMHNGLVIEDHLTIINPFL